MGRKKLPPEQARAKPLRIRLNAEERRLVDEAARLQGFGNTSTWVRAELLRLARGVAAFSRSETPVGTAVRT
jgi:uncharacterized protein (DUF1778 family)